MGARQPGVRAGSLSQQVDPCLTGDRLIVVVTPGELWPGKLCGRNMDQVPAEQDPFLARVENVSNVARSVAGHRECHHMVVHALSVSERGKQLSKAHQM